jgi:diguanylate cyclase (GGDEF) domain
VTATDAGNLAADSANSGDTKIDLLALGVVCASILLFFALGTEIGPGIVRSFIDGGAGPDSLLLNAFLLNIAIIIFGWSRYRQLCREINLRKSAELQARHLAELDSLTGLMNRKSFAAAIGDMLSAAHARNLSVGLIVADIDGFKAVNDLNGYNVGDLMLRECAARIGALVPAGALVGRIGGDEFGIALIVDANRKATVESLAALVSATLVQRAEIDAAQIEVTASVGIAHSETKGLPTCPDARDLLDRAGIAAQHARQGCNRWVWFEARMGDEIRFRSELERGVRQGIQKGEFVPYYEQQIDLQTGELAGFEMLARWNSPKFGLVSPDIFIPVAEDIGAIGDLSESVIRQALEDAKAWDPRLTLAVNISPLQLRDPWFSQKLLRLLVEANFPAQRLEIEITESCLHQNVAQARSLITSLKNQGIQVSLDDFGTGYSSLAQLRSLPFDRIKIDRSFVSNIVENSDNAAIVHAIAMLGKGMNLPITAEGIETGDVLEHLLQYGQIKGQGYLYGRPRPSHELAEWLAERGIAGPSPSATAITQNVRDLPPASVPLSAGTAPKRTGHG